MKTKEEILQACTIEGSVVKLPAVQLDRKLYQEVAKSLELIGGKWKGGKIAGFVFQEGFEDEIKSLILKISEGNKVNLKKEFQFFGTPDSLADRLVKIADIIGYENILEPSAGQGAIINAITRKHPGMRVDCYELMPTNQTFLKKIPTASLLGENFLEAPEDKKYERIIANPPFSSNQDIDHVYKMYKMLQTGGRLVSVMSTHWQLSTNKKETEFRNFLNQVAYSKVHEVEAGAFKQSGTMIPTVIVEIQNI